ncbi:MAG: HD-GYP domain-containing protein [Burkholderiaceae bacterium]
MSTEPVIDQPPAVPDLPPLEMSAPEPVRHGGNAPVDSAQAGAAVPSAAVGPRSAQADGGKPGNARPDGETVTLFRYKLPVDRLSIGMFVAELDRPWEDTPFLLQGFRIGENDELATLIQHCGTVFVDIEKSDPEVVAAIRDAALLDMPKPEPRSLRASLRSFATLDDRTRKTKKRYSQGSQRLNNYLDQTVPGHALKPGRNGIGQWINWLIELLVGAPKPDPKVRKRRKKVHRDELRRMLPPDIKLRRYADQVTIEEELPRARETFKRSETTIESLVKDVRTGKLPSFDDVNEVVDDMVQSMVDNPDAMMWVAKMRDQDASTYGHAVKVSLYLIALGRHLGFPRQMLGNLGMIGLLADLGKTKLPKTLLEKPGMLTAKEYALVREHVRLGLEALSEDKLPKEVVQGISQHHERLDGSGYPKGLKDQEISIYGRMAAIADTFAAMITPRPYANAVSPHDAILNLFEWSGSSFHEPLVGQFVQAVGVFPVGSLVELSTGEVCIVLAHNKVRRLEPRVLVLTWPDKRQLDMPIERNLFDRPKGPDGKPIRIVRAIAAGEYGIKIRDFYGGDLAKANALI